MKTSFCIIISIVPVFLLGCSHPEQNHWSKLEDRATGLIPLPREEFLNIPEYRANMNNKENIPPKPNKDKGR